MTSIEVAIHSAEQITYETCANVCNDIANIPGQTEEVKSWCLHCSNAIRNMLSKTQAKWGVLNG